MNGLWWLALALTGFGVGVVAGMFGVGGGFLLTPILTVAFGVPLPIAIGSGLCQMIGTSLTALMRHQKLKQGEIKIDVVMLAGSVFGVSLGTETIQVLSKAGTIAIGHGALPVAKLVISIGYILLLGFVAVRMWGDAGANPKEGAPPPGPLTKIPWAPYTILSNARRRISIPVLSYLGFFIGFLSGILGIGGGIALLPILIYGIGMSTRMAAGTGILTLFVTSVIGTFTNSLHSNVHLGIALCLLAGSSMGARIGANLTARLDVARLKSLFAGLVTLTALAVAWDLVRTALAARI